MRAFSLVTVVALAAFTALSMALQPQFASMYLLDIGGVSISTFDLVFIAGLVLLVARNALHLRPDPIPMNRVVIWLCLGYVGYQLFVVLPVAVVLYDLRPVDVVRDLEVRLGLLFIPAIYGVVLKYWRASVLVAIFDATAAVLAIWVIGRYLIYGGQGYYDGGIFRLRTVWGGATFLFAWLIFTSLFYWPVRVWRLGLATLGLAGIVLANHRSAILGLGAAMIVQLVALKGVTKRALLALAAVGVVVLVVFIAAPAVRENVVYSLSTMFDPNADRTAADRVTHSAAALDYFQEHPLGDFTWNQRYYLVNMGSENNFPPHNFVVQLLVTQGVIASFLYFAIIAVSALIAWRNRRDRLSAVMLAYLTFYVVMCLFNANIDLVENVAMFFIPVALILHQNRELCQARAVAPAPIPEDPLNHQADRAESGGGGHIATTP
jgi:O-antigen ligase